MTTTQRDALASAADKARQLVAAIQGLPLVEHPEFNRYLVYAGAIADQLASDVRLENEEAEKAAAFTCPDVAPGADEPLERGDDDLSGWRSP
jgi:hypothetical protein